MSDFKQIEIKFWGSIMLSENQRAMIAALKMHSANHRRKQNSERWVKVCVDDGWALVNKNATTHLLTRVAESAEIEIYHYGNRFSVTTNGDNRKLFETSSSASAIQKANEFAKSQGGWKCP